MALGVVIIYNKSKKHLEGQIRQFFDKRVVDVSTKTM